MMGRRFFCSLPVAIGMCVSSHAMAASEEAMAQTNSAATVVAVASEAPTDSIVRSAGSVTVSGKKYDYKAQSGGLVISRPDGKPYHRMSFTAYTLDRKDAAPRPLTFVWNGGPGGSSVWLHVGAFGPQRIVPASSPSSGGAVARMANNDYTLLDQSDLVFIDCPGAGASEVVGDGTLKEVSGVDADAEAFTRFIVKYLNMNNRWDSPKFIVGESYGTLRNAVVARMLQEQQVELTGIIFISTILNSNNLGINFPTVARGPDQWYIATLPTFAATGFHHHLVEQQGSIDDWTERARAFARGPYAAVLAKGDAAPEAERLAVAREMSALSGLSTNFILDSDLRVSTDEFRKELLRTKGKVLGRFDAREVGDDTNMAGSGPTYDPSFAANTSEYYSTFITYRNNILGSQNPYRLTVTLPGFEWGHTLPIGGMGDLPSGKYSFVGYDLGLTLRRNPKLKTFFASGYFDLATPFFQAEYDASHLGIGARYQRAIRVRNYAAGHAIYEDENALKSLRGDLRSFYQDALTSEAR